MRRTSVQTSEHITCDICGREWNEESQGHLPRDKECDDMCSNCKEAYIQWKFSRKKEANKLVLD